MVIDHAKPDLLAALEDLGQRMTRPRVRLARYLETKPEAFSAEDVNTELPSVGRATIYRTLKLLVEAGALCKTAMPDGSPLYKVDYAVHHHHIVCTLCGKVDEFRHPAVERTFRAMRKEIPGEIVGHRLEVFVICVNCKTARDRASA